MPTIAQASDQIRNRRLSPLELTRACLDAIERRSPELNAFITINAESAITEARRAEAEIAQGNWRGPLHGIPIALKDILDTAGTRTTAASNVFRDRIPSEDAEVVRRLKAAGAILIGKTNLHEFAYGGSSVISAFGPVKNPLPGGFIAGGSSGGSAAAVAAGMCCAAIGTDTAGSIRVPAACCGIVGLKPTYGRVSNRGVVPLSVSLDHTGPITQTVEDAAILLAAIAGYDSKDATSVNLPVSDYVKALSLPVKMLRVGVPRNYFLSDVNSAVAARFEAALAVIRSLVASMKDIELDVPTDRKLQSAESYRYHEQFLAAHAALYQPETLRRIRAGADVSDADMQEQLAELRRIRQAITASFEDVDILLTPTIPIPVPKLRDMLDHPEDLRPRELDLLHNTRPFNVWGLPSLTVPSGAVAGGSPTGLQISAAPWREDIVLALGAAYEQARGA